MNKDIPIEEHPFEPFLPDNAKILIMGTFPPKSQRWSMNFYYPNKINDFWRIIGLIFMSDKNALFDFDKNKFRLDAIKALLYEKGIALSDTGRTVRRLRDNASDKYLEIVTPIPIDSILTKIPECNTLATTGEKAGQTLAEITQTECPTIGNSVKATLNNGRTVDIYRMPSTSRAYPLALEKKAEVYMQMFWNAGIV